MIEDVLSAIEYLFGLAYQRIPYAPEYLVMGVPIYLEYHRCVTAVSFLYPTDDMLLKPVKPEYRGASIVVVPTPDILDLGFSNWNMADTMWKALQEEKEAHTQPWIKWFLDMQSLREEKE